MADIILAPCCSECGAVIHEDVNFKDLTRESSAYCYTSPQYEIEPSHCENCGAIFTKIIVSETGRFPIMTGKRIKRRSKMSTPYMECDRSMCYQQDDCEACPVTEAFRKAKYKIVVDIENVVCACDDSAVTYECFVPILSHPEDVYDMEFRIRDTVLKSWPEYVYSLRVGNCIIFNHMPEDTRNCIKQRYHIADSYIDYYYRIKEIADDLPEM